MSIKGPVSFSMLAGALSLAALRLSAFDPPSIVLGPELLVSPGEPYAHVETMVAADPADARRLIAGSMVLTPGSAALQFQFGTSAYLSADGGRTWTARRLPADGALWDPIGVFTPKRTTIFVSVAPPSRTFVWRSPSNGTDLGRWTSEPWTDRVELPFLDHPMVAVDWTSSPFRGAIYMTGKMGEERESPLMMLRSRDDGRTFETVTVATATPGVLSLNPIVLAGGTVFVPYRTRPGALQPDGTRVEEFFSVRSSDGGRSFSDPVRITSRSLATRSGDVSFPVFAAGQVGSVERIYAVWHDHSRGNARLMLTMSDDGGRTWTASTGVLAEVEAAVTHGAANVAVAADGTVGISWLDRRLGAAALTSADPDCARVSCFNETFDLRFTASTDSGKTWLPATRISTTTSQPVSKQASRFWPGTDYMLSAASADGTFHLVWPDGRGGTFQLYARRVTVKEPTSLRRRP